MPDPVAEPGSTGTSRPSTEATSPRDLGRQPVAEADELADERRGGRGVELGGRRELLEATGVHDADPVGDGERLLLVVGDEQGRGADLDLDAADLVAQLHAHLGVEGRQRLVEEQHRRLDRERPGQRDALLLAAGELVGVAVGVLAEPDEVEHVAGALAPRASRRCRAA